jgi:hypothetical protein
MNRERIILSLLFLTFRERLQRFFVFPQPFRQLPKMIFFLPETSGGCRKRFSDFRRLSAVAENDFLASADFRRLPKMIFSDSTE